MVTAPAALASGAKESVQAVPLPVTSGLGTREGLWVIDPMEYPVYQKGQPGGWIFLISKGPTLPGLVQ
jgi:hypothetical protein